jgi:hypothetical protein
MAMLVLCAFAKGPEELAIAAHDLDVQDVRAADATAVERRGDGPSAGCAGCLAATMGSGGHSTPALIECRP